MNPGIFYLYEYKNNQKQRNVGFLKLIRHYQACTVHIQARQIPVTRQDALKLSAFYMENDTAHAQIISEITCSTHAISARLNVAESRFPDQHTLNNIHGFLLQLPNGNILAATSPGITLDTHNIRYSNENSESEPPAPSKAEPASDAPSVPLQEEDTQMTAPVPLQTEPAHAHIEAESLDLCAVPSADTPADAGTISGEETSDSEDTTPQAEEHIRKIQRSEMSCLPRRYWNLANNSFLLHGYHNYNHLLLVEKDGHYWLGIPGIYDTREARAAELFGFPQFTDSYNQKLSLSKDERNEQGIFGYWCRYLR